MTPGVLVCAVLCFAQIDAQQPQLPRINERVETILDRAYRLPQVQRYCMANPDAVYVVEVDNVTIAVRCSAWVNWAKEHPDEARG